MGQYQRHGSGERQQQQAAPKPFDFVSLPKRIDKKPPTGHDQYHENCLTGQIQGTIEALSPIHIGSGVIDIGDDVELIKTAVRTGDKIVIPGSSLKGAIRSVVEAISESCVCKVSRDSPPCCAKRFYGMSPKRPLVCRVPNVRCNGVSVKYSDTGCTAH